VIAAIAMTWSAASASAEGQMPLLIDEILMSEYGNQEAISGDSAVAVDGSNMWLTLRPSPEGHDRRSANLSEPLEFAAAEMEVSVDSSTGLSAEDYRYPPTSSHGSRLWGYDGDPLDRGVYKRELRGSNARYGYSRPRASSNPGPEGQPGRASQIVEPAHPAVAAMDSGRIIGILAYGPRYVLDAFKSIYRGDNALVYGTGLLIFVFGLAALTDLMASARRA
jgi:hypothetical protein